MICSFCGREFDEETARRACGGCAIVGGCRKIKCPHCQYEMPEEPRLIKWLRSLWHRRSRK